MNYEAIELTLPDTFILWDGMCHEGDNMSGRTIMQHIRSNTVIEVLDEEMGAYINDGVKFSELKFINNDGDHESLILAVHYSIAGELILDDILDKAKEWFVRYCEWEDKNMEDEEE